MSENQSSAPIAENKMGTMPVGKLVFNMSLPMMISMLVQALYNIVDSIFVAKLSENALTAVSLAFPLQTLLIAVATGTGVGMNALLSKSLGERNFKKANKIADNAALIVAVLYIFISALLYSSTVFLFILLLPINSINLLTFLLYPSIVEFDFSSSIKYCVKAPILPFNSYPSIILLLFI